MACETAAHCSTRSPLCMEPQSIIGNAHQTSTNFSLSHPTAPVRGERLFLRPGQHTPAPILYEDPAFSIGMSQESTPSRRVSLCALSKMKRPARSGRHESTMLYARSKSREKCARHVRKWRPRRKPHASLVQPMPCVRPVLRAHLTLHTSPF